MRFFAGFWSVAVLSVLGSTVFGNNLVRNGGFEDVTEGWRWVNSKNAKAFGVVDGKIVHSGSRSYQIRNTSKLSPYVYCQIAQDVAVKPNTVYQISAWGKGRSVSRCRIQADRNWSFVYDFPRGDFDWQRVSGIFTTGADQKSLPLMIHCEDTTGNFWVDDVAVEEWSQTRRKGDIFVRSTDSADSKLSGSSRFLVARKDTFRERSPWVAFRDPVDREFGGDVRATWDLQHFILDVVVKDKSDGPAGAGGAMWMLDSIQVGIETHPTSENVAPGYSETSFELGFSLLPSGKVDFVAWQPGNFDFSGVEATGSKMAGGYRLRIAIPWRNLKVDEKKIPDYLGLNVLVNDGSAERRFYAWTPGIGDGKNPNEFAQVVLADKNGPQPSYSRILLNQPADKIYDREEEIVGRFVEYATSPLPAERVELIAKSQSGEIKTLGTVNLPKVSGDSVRRFDFVVPAELLDKEQRYFFSVSPRPTMPGKPVIRQNVKTRRESKLSTIKKRIAVLEERLKREPQWAVDSYVKMGVLISRRFVEHVQAGGWDGKQGLDWDMMQLEEVEWVLDQTDRRLEQLASGQVKVFEKVDLEPGTVQVKNGAIFAKASGSNAFRPFFLVGYGAWDKVIKDMGFLCTTGMNLIQQEGWLKMMNPDLTVEYVGVPSQPIAKNLETCVRHHVMTDFNLSPHVMPDWLTANPEIHEDVVSPGFIFYNVDHPEIRRVLEKWIELAVSQTRKKPALLSMCLANEPNYSTSGRDKYSKPRWTKYLAERHGTIGVLNELYGTKYTDFKQVPVPPFPKGIGEWPKDVRGMRAYYDWMIFNNENFGDFHRWLRDQVKRWAPEIRTHSKIMPHIFKRETLFCGIDPERITELTDLAGNDTFGMWVWTPGGPYAFNWQEEMAWYDLLHSFGGKPVINSENHLLDENLPPIHIPAGYTRTEVWQSALHHLWASVIWVWEVFPPNESGTIYRRPANIYAAGRAMLDLNRLADEAATITNQPAQIAILYSMESIFWQDDCASLIAPIYTAVDFLGQPVTFVSERQLAEGKIPAKVKWIILPHATHVKGSTVRALGEFAKNGGQIIGVGTNCLAWDEYHRKHDLPAWVESMPTVSLPGDDKAICTAIRPIFEKGGLKIVPLYMARTTTPAWGVEYRTVEYKGKILVPMVNYLNKAVTVTIGIQGKGTDLLSGEVVDLSVMELRPMEPRLVEVKTVE